MYKLHLIILIKPSRFIYVLQIRHGHKSAFQFLFFSLKVLKDDVYLVFSGIRFHICGHLYIIVSVPDITVFLLSEYMH